MIIVEVDGVVLWHPQGPVGCGGSSGSSGGGGKRTGGGGVGRVGEGLIVVCHSVNDVASF